MLLLQGLLRLMTRKDDETRIWNYKPAISCRYNLCLGPCFNTTAASGRKRLVVNVPGFGSYDIITVSGSYASLTDAQQSKLEQQAWLSSPNDAQTFGDAWLAAGPTHPLAYFVFTVAQAGGQPIAGYPCIAQVNPDCYFANISVNPGASFSFASPISTPGPGPLPLFGAAAPFGYSRRLRQRIQAGRSSLPVDPAA